MRNIFAVTATAVALMLPTAALAGDLVIYDASEEVGAALAAAFSAKHPDIDVKVVSGSTGPIAERAIAEKGKPQADVVYLVNNFALEQLKQAGVFEPYEPKDSKIARRSSAIPTASTTSISPPRCAWSSTRSGWRRRACPCPRPGKT